MKKRGVTFIETVVAITIFLIGIIPVAMLTLNSMGNLQRSSEIEEGARVATTVINYIKSQGYDSIIDNGGILDPTNTLSSDPTSLTYTLKFDEIDGSSYILDISNGKSDFEKDFLGRTSWPGGKPTPDNSLFFINSLGISSETIKIIVNIATSDLKVVGEYYNPITGVTTTDGIIIGEGGIIKDPIIYGNVYIKYQTLSNTLSEDKFYDQNFVITPLENYKD